MAYDGSVVQGYLRKAHETDALTEREKHLVGLAVTLTRGCQVCTRGRLEKARSAGIDDGVLNALVEVVAAVNAGVAAATARESFGVAAGPAAEACGELCSPGAGAGR
jgi:alkylhydroperoxidase/carboxymuconolactone decarboxylase family protein YurZ